MLLLWINKAMVWSFIGNTLYTRCFFINLLSAYVWYIYNMANYFVFAHVWLYYMASALKNRSEVTKKTACQIGRHNLFIPRHLKG